MNEKEILQIKELIVEPVIKEVQLLRQEVYDNKVENTECHKTIKKDLEGLKSFKLKLIGAFSVISLILSIIGSWIWNKLNGVK